MRTVLVTGATSGIGEAAALALADRGWWVAASGRDTVRGAALTDRLAERGRFFAADITEDGEPDRLVDEVVETRDRLDAVVNNAGVHDTATLADLPVEQLDRILDTDLRAAMLVARAAVRAMRKGGGGVLVNVASEAGLRVVPGQVAYNVAKAGLVMLTRCVAVDHANDGIRAVSVCPGTTRTALVDAGIAAADDPAGRERALAEMRPAGRLGRVDEIAAAIAFAASADAEFMTGTELVVDGGFTAA